MRLRRFLALVLLGVIPGLLPAAAPRASEAEQVRIIGLVAEQLRARLDQLPVLVPAGHPTGTVQEKAVTLNRNAVTVEGQRFDAVVIHAPAAPASFAWAFASPPNLASWYILREQGDMKGFSDFLRRPRDKAPGSAALVPAEVAQVTLQKLDARHLAPGQRYVLWFRFKDDQPVEFTVRAGFFAAPSLNNTRLPALLFLGGK